MGLGQREGLGLSKGLGACGQGLGQREGGCMGGAGAEGKAGCMRPGTGVEGGRVHGWGWGRGKGWVHVARDWGRGREGAWVGLGQSGGKALKPLKKIQLTLFMYDELYQGVSQTQYNCLYLLLVPSIN